MSQASLFGDLPDLARWRRCGHGKTGHASYDHISGMRVQWCGHATALRPYYVILPDGSNLDIYANGSGPGFTTFCTSTQAKAAVENIAAGLCACGHGVDACAHSGCKSPAERGEP